MIAHGYGMLSTYFSKKFTALPSDHEIIVPEGLHRFYLHGTEGRVGASWMTKEERESDINDYLQYLNALYTTLRKDAPLIAFGFSQGVATICRWVAQKQIQPDHVVLWAGVIPPDMDAILWKEVYNEVPITIFVGTDDQYRTGFHDKLYADLQSAGASVNVIEFEGKHEVNPDILSEWVNGVFPSSQSL